MRAPGRSRCLSSARCDRLWRAHARWACARRRSRRVDAGRQEAAAHLRAVLAVRPVERDGAAVRRGRHLHLRRRARQRTRRDRRRTSPTHEGGGQQGLAPGAMHTQIIDHPVVNLSVDGESAKGRWYGFFLLSDGTGQREHPRRRVRERIRARERRVEDRRPPLLSAVRRPLRDRLEQLARAGTSAILPYHFTPDESGIPIPPPVGAAPTSQGDARASSKSASR